MQKRIWSYQTDFQDEALFFVFLSMKIYETWLRHYI